MSSLQDQLLKAGLVDKKKARQAKKDKRKSTKIQHKSNQVVVDEDKLQAQKTRDEKTERDRQLNAERKAEADRKAIRAQIKQLIEMNRQDKGGDAVTYNFTDAGKIKKIYVSAAIQRELVRGRLAIVSLEESYQLVPAVVAEKIAERDESVVVAMSARSVDDQSIEDDEEDPYADYQIPDDLMW